MLSLHKSKAVVEAGLKASGHGTALFDIDRAQKTLAYVGPYDIPLLLAGTRDYALQYTLHSVCIFGKLMAAYVFGVVLLSWVSPAILGNAAIIYGLMCLGSYWGAHEAGVTDRRAVFMGVALWPMLPFASLLAGFRVCRSLRRLALDVLEMLNKHIEEGYVVSARKSGGELVTLNAADLRRVRKLGQVWGLFT